MTIRRISRRAAALVFALVGVLWTPALVRAHAHLIRSSPSANAKLAAAPTEIGLWFSEDPELKLTVVELVDSAGHAVSLGPIEGVKPMGVRLPITAAMGAGRYTVSWRTVAADGHASSGKFSFTVPMSVPLPTPAVTGSSPSAGPRTTAPSAPTPPATDSVVRHKAVSNALVVPNAEGAASASTAIRWAELVALLTLVGAVIFRLAILPAAKWPAEMSAEASDRALRLGRAVLLLFAIATLTRALAQADLLPDVGDSRLDALMMLVRGTRWGFGWAIGAVGAAVVLIGLQVARTGLAGWVVAAIGVVAVAISEALTGHSATSPHMAVAVAADVSHLLGAGGWLGGLTTLLLCAMPALKRVDDEQASHAGSALIRAYHGSAIECVTIVVISALLALWTRLPSIDALWRTPYGMMVIRKVVFVIIVLIFGLYHWRRVVAAQWTPEVKFRFQRSAIAELAFGAVVVAITALLISTPLP